MTSGWDSVPSPYVELSRDAWRGLRENTPLPLTPGELDALRGLKDPIDIAEVEEVYLPLSRLLNLFFLGDGRLRDTVSGFLGGAVQPTPFIIGVAGSVAVGKSTTSRLLRTLLARWPEHPSVELVTTDSFLYPNAVLSERGLMDRKGSPSPTTAARSSGSSPRSRRARTRRRSRCTRTWSTTSCRTRRRPSGGPTS